MKRTNRKKKSEAKIKEQPKYKRGKAMRVPKKQIQ
jgi:hypothetical protein